MKCFENTEQRELIIAKTVSKGWEPIRKSQLVPVIQEFSIKQRRILNTAKYRAIDTNATKNFIVLYRLRVIKDITNRIILEKKLR